MGITHSNVGSSVKQQAEGGVKEMFNLVDIKGGGELVEMMKKINRNRFRDYTPIEEKIKSDVPRFLYNAGAGRLVPIEELVRRRNKERAYKLKEKKMTKSANTLDLDAATRHRSSVSKKFGFREVCCNLDERGAVGDHILHMCLLNATSVHAELAKLLLRNFPKLINDIYQGEEYYGESVLHMAIVNEDPAMVKFLIDNGANVHERACGNFFCPDDQKPTRRDNIEHEWVDVDVKTNYAGFCYFGEYPLGFAACLGQEECVRLLLAKGADPNKQDTNGNTTMHMLVIHDKEEMFDLIREAGGRLDIKNALGLTPLTLAARLARKKMFDHIMNSMRQTYWVYGDVTCAAHPLAEVDSVDPHGKINENSVMNLIVYGEEPGHLDMMDGLLADILTEKWKTFAKGRFLRRFSVFVLQFLLMAAALLLKRGKYQREADIGNCSTTNVSKSHRDMLLACHYIPLCTFDWVRLCLEALTISISIGFLVLMGREIYYESMRAFLRTLKTEPAKALFLVGLLCVVLLVPARFTCFQYAEDLVSVIAILCESPYFLFFCRFALVMGFDGFKITGPFVVMIYNMIKGDLLRFVCIYLIFVIGFSQAFHIILAGEVPMFSHPIEAMVGMFLMSLGEFAEVYSALDDSPYEIIAKLLFIVYMILVTILLINMLIAMMGNTYTIISETQNEWFRQWAKIILLTEQTVSPWKRVAFQKLYSEPMGNNQRGFVIRWHQSEAEKEELRQAREQICADNQTLFSRRRDGRVVPKKFETERTASQMSSFVDLKNHSAILVQT